METININLADMNFISNQVRRGEDRENIIQAFVDDNEEVRPSIVRRIVSRLIDEVEAQ